MPMKPYEHDDAVYRRLESEGKTSWDEQADPAATFENFVLRPFLEETLAVIGANGHGRRVMEVGCGTGPVSCFLAGKGFVVEGIDLSPHAVAMARQQAAKRGFPVRFEVADVCDMPPGFGNYDVIVDGHCPHCLIGDGDRQRALAAIRSLLKDDGMFLVETMVWHEKMQVGERYRYDDRGVLWVQAADPSSHDAGVEKEGVWYLPYRRILRPEEVAGELRKAGFAAVFERVVGQRDESKPRLLQVRCVRSGVART